MSDMNLRHVGFENYILGSSVSHSIYQKGGICIFIRSDVCFSHVDLSVHCVEKTLEFCAVKLE
jgi:hypothetical protein